MVMKLLRALGTVKS